jgi:type VI secretion system secreted protein Hcp
MAGDMFMKIDSVDAESKVDGHVKSIDIMSWSWGMSQTGTMHTATGGGAGKVNVHDVSFTKLVDASSPRIVQACCSGEHFKKALLTCRKAGGKAPVEYMVITLEDVLVSSYTPGGSSGDDRISESVTLNFGKFKAAYTGQDATGAKTASKICGWNIAENKPYG